jgi:spore coat protein JC
MWNYEKRLQYPVNIKENNPKLAKVIMSQFGGPDGELAASMRYLSQRYAMPYKEVMAILTDVGTEELGHMEIVSSIVHQLTNKLTPQEIMEQGFADYYVDHTVGLWPQSAGGVPNTATFFQSKGDPITDLHEDLAAEQKARTTYDNILRLVDDPDVREPIKFLREREIVHYQRFGEGLQLATDKLNCKNFYAFNPSFDKHCMKNCKNSMK